MKVSIITVVYNGVDTIEQCVQSVLSQEYPHIEYIIIDGNSADGTLDILKHYGKKIDKCISEDDGGIYDAMNKGIAHASGEVIGILNADDFYSSNSILSKVVDVFKNDQCDGLYADLVYVNRKNTDKVVRYWKAGEPKSFLSGWHPPHPTFFVRKSVYEQHGLYNTSLKIAADFEMMLRLIEKDKIKLSYIDEVIVKMRTGGASNKSMLNILRSYFQNRRAFIVNGIRYPISYPFIRYLGKVKQYFASA